VPDHWQVASIANIHLKFISTTSTTTTTTAAAAAAVRRH